jgi:3-isopropylmalate/(R)-2-methylmalate dehydratase small subunit
MERFIQHTGIAVPLEMSAVDTDQIIPAEFLKRITRHGFEDGCFYAWRKDEDFVLNLPRYQGASILVAGPDFGTGSSREHAVWALQDYGFKVVISSRFADIFKGNASKAGLLTAEVPQTNVEELWNWIHEHEGAVLEVDLEQKSIRFGGESVSFEIDDYVRFRLLEGLDDIGQTLKNADKITDFERKRPTFLPKVFTKSAR